MGLLGSFKDGTQTDLTSLKYGKDRKGGGSSNEPYIFNPILSNVIPGTFNNILQPLPQGTDIDGIVRGGLAGPLHAADDVKRIFRKLFDNKNISGTIFTIKQQVLSKIAPRTQHSKGLLNEGIYNPLNTLAQVGGGFLGFHTEKQGPIVGVTNRYLDSVKPVLNIPTTQLTSIPEGPALPNQPTPDIDNDGIPDTIDVNSINPPTIGSNSRLAGLFFVHQQGFPVKNKALFPFKLHNPLINVYSYRGGPSSILGIGRTNLKFATTVGGAPIKLKKFNTNSFTDGVNRNYIGSGAEYRLAFLYRHQYNTFNYREDTGFFTGKYFFNLAKKQDNQTLLKTVPLSKQKSTSFNFRKKYSESPRFVNRLVNYYGIYYNKYIPGDPNSVPIISIDTGITNTTLGTDKDNQVPLRTINNNPTTDFQWNINQIKTVENNKSVNKSGILESAPIIQENFTRRINAYKNYAPSYSPNNIIDNRIGLGNPGGRNSKTAYQQPGNAVRYDDIDLTINTPNDSNSTRTREQLNAALDKLNALGVYGPTRDMVTGQVGGNSTIPVDDLVKFNVGVISNGNASRSRFLHFRAFLGDITDDYSSNWDTHNYVGRAENFYNYTGQFERNISLSFIVAAQSKAELIPMYKKLNFLASAMAGDYTGAGYLAGNLMELTIGGYVYRTPGFLKGINYTLKQGYPWEIGITKGAGEGFGIDTTVKELCHYVEVSGFNFTVIHDFLPTIAKTPDITTKRFISLQDIYGNSYNTFGNRPENEIVQEKLAELERNSETNTSETLPEDPGDILFDLSGLGEEIQTAAFIDDDVVITSPTNNENNTSPNPDIPKPNASAQSTRENNIVVGSQATEDLFNARENDIVTVDVGSGPQEVTITQFSPGLGVFGTAADGSFVDLTAIFEQDDSFAETLDEVVIKPKEDRAAATIEIEPISLTEIPNPINTPETLEKVEEIPITPSNDSREAKDYSDFRDKFN